MKYILKEGKGKATFNDRSDLLYICKCPHCGCEFICDTNYTDYDKQEQELFIRCPHCREIFYEEENYSRLNELLWFNKIKFLLKALKNITEIYKNPLVNDASGANDCRELDNVIEKQLDYFNEFYNDEQNY